MTALFVIKHMSVFFNYVRWNKDIFVGTVFKKKNIWIGPDPELDPGP